MNYVTCPHCGSNNDPGERCICPKAVEIRSGGNVAEQPERRVSDNGKTVNAELKLHENAG